MPGREIAELPREKLLELIDIYSKNWLAMDGVWFQSIEETYGMDEAMVHDIRAWRRYAAFEAARIKAFLGLEEHPGLSGLCRALAFRFYANLNRCEAVETDGALIYRMLECRVQKARERKGMPWHPCKAAGLVEYAVFARTIDDRLVCEALSCYPDVTDPGCHCAWKFTLRP